MIEKERVEWIGEDETEKFAMTFLIPQDEMRYLIDAIDFSLQLPKMKYNKTRFDKLVKMRQTLKDYSKGR